MKVGDLIEYCGDAPDALDIIGVVVGFDNDGDPRVWQDGDIAPNYMDDVKVIDESR